MDKSAIRSNRISTLTKMYMMGKSWDEIKAKAYGFASKATAEDYLDEVRRRAQIIKDKASTPGITQQS